MPLLEPTVENFSNLSSVYWAYQTRLDSTVMIFVAEDCLTFFKFCGSQIECDSLEKRFLVEDVVADEFMRLQEAGVFRGTASEADSVIHHILEKMSSIRPSGLASISYNMFRKNEDTAEIFLTSGKYCTYDWIAPRPYLCSLVDSVRQCGPSFREQYPLSLKNRAERRLRRERGSWRELAARPLLCETGTQRFLADRGLHELSRRFPRRFPFRALPLLL